MIYLIGLVGLNNRWPNQFDNRFDFENFERKILGVSCNCKTHCTIKSRDNIVKKGNYKSQKKTFSYNILIFIERETNLVLKKGHGQACGYVNGEETAKIISFWVHSVFTRCRVFSFLH